MTGRRRFSVIALAAALFAALAVFAFSSAVFADYASFAQAQAASADHHCPNGDCADDSADDSAASDVSCCAGAVCSGVWLAPQAPIAAPAAFVRLDLSIPPGRLAAGVGAPPDPRPPRSFV
ncbi:MAG TPA: hypothetical protein PKZ97_08045 [Azospirillaceae bacterium]|nr:hypothetical protein [Azospirillaceae bacterium]HRQ81055.1 hypothetical protein [Azospirillaceae bacterium]